jgi:hypothetical protein
MRRAHTLRLVRSAVSREPGLRDTAARWWSRGRRIGAQVRADTSVRRIADRIGMGFAPEGQGELRTTAQAAVGELLGNVPQPGASAGSAAAPPGKVA